MPFTFSHPAAVVPLARWKHFNLQFSALVIGSMSPDIEYFLYIPRDVQFGHTVCGIFLFCVPAGFILLWIFHRILKFPLLSLLPLSHQERLFPLAEEFHFAPFKRLAIILLSLIIGAFTHLGWDSLTHHYGWAVKEIPAMNMLIKGTFLGSFRIYEILQHGSTLLGGGLLVYWYIKWFRNAPPCRVSLPLQLSGAAKIRFFVLIAGGAWIPASCYGFISAAKASGFALLQLFARNTVLAVVSILFAELFIFGLCWHMVNIFKNGGLARFPLFSRMIHRDQ